MPLEPPVTNIADLNPLWPLGADPASISDDNHRNIKKALLNDFAGFTGSVLVTGVDGGPANAYTLTPATALPAYGLRMTAVFSPAANNTGACTLEIGGLGPKNLKSVSGANLVTGDLVIGNVYAAFYNGAEFRLLSVTKNYADQLAFGSALPAQVADYFLTSDGTSAFFSSLLKASAIRFADSADLTKRIAFNAASIATGNTRTITMPDKDITLAEPGTYLLQTVVAANSSTVDIDTTFSATYDRYIIEISAMVVQTDNVDFNMLMKIGGVYVVANYNSHSMTSKSTSTAYVGSIITAGGAIQLATNLGNAAGRHSEFTVRIDAPASTTLAKMAHWTGGVITNVGAHEVAFGSGHNTGTAALTGIRFAAGAGNIVSGTFRLYGIKNA